MWRYFNPVKMAFASTHGRSFRARRSRLHLYLHSQLSRTNESPATSRLVPELEPTPASTAGRQSNGADVATARRCRIINLKLMWSP